MSDNNPSLQNDSFEPASSSDSHRFGVEIFMPKGLSRFVASRKLVRIDFDKGIISQGRIKISFSRIKAIELRFGILGVTDGKRWICIDTLRFCDKSGPLSMHDGSLSPTFAQILYDFRRALPASVRDSEGEFLEEAFEFRYVVKVEVGSIVISILGVFLFFGYYYSIMGENMKAIIDFDGLRLLIALMGLATVWLYFRRWSSWVRFDSNGIHLNRAWRKKIILWSEINCLRQQGLELELEGDKVRAPFNLDILRGAGAPLLLYRGIRPVVTPLGGRFLQWLRTKTVEQPEIPVIGSSRDRNKTRLWLLVMILINIVLFYILDPPGFLTENKNDGKNAANNIELVQKQEAFKNRLINMGARTEDSFKESWRFFTALFLHGDTLHIGFNMLVLVIVAPWLGRIFGWVRGTAHYLLSGFFGNILAQLGQDLPFIETEATFSVGSSTAILGIIGSLLGAVYRRPHSIPLAVRARFRWAIPLMVLLTLGSGMVINFMDNGAHLGGFLAGFLLVWVIPPPKSTPKKS